MATKQLKFFQMELEQQLEALGFQKGTIVSRGWYHEDGYHLLLLRNKILVIQDDHYIIIPNERGSGWEGVSASLAIKGLVGVDLSWCDNRIEEIQDLLADEFEISIFDLHL